MLRLVSPLLAAALLLCGPGILTAQSLPRPSHVVVVVEENHSYSEIINSPQAPLLTPWRPRERSSRVLMRSLIQASRITLRCSQVQPKGLQMTPAHTHSEARILHTNCSRPTRLSGRIRKGYLSPARKLAFPVSTCESTRPGPISRIYHRR